MYSNNLAVPKSKRHKEDTKEKIAYISRECVNCTDRTKRIAGKFNGRDEKGKRFSGDMYECDNLNCHINLERMKTQKNGTFLPKNNFDRLASTDVSRSLLYIFPLYPFFRLRIDKLFHRIVLQYRKQWENILFCAFQIVIQIVATLYTLIARDLTLEIRNKL